MADKKEWYKNYSVLIRDEPSLVIGIEQLLSKIQNVQNLTYHQSIKKVYEAGLEALAQDPMYASIELSESVLLTKLYAETKAQEARKRQFRRIYKELGPERIQTAAAEAGVSFDELLDEYTLPVASPSERMKRWIVEHVSDGEEHETKEVTDTAIIEGVLPGRDAPRFDKDYGTFKRVASELGVSGGRRGWWQKG